MNNTKGIQKMGMLYSITPNRLSLSQYRERGILTALLLITKYISGKE
jgi:hypothetical protein